MKRRTAEPSPDAPTIPAAVPEDREVTIPRASAAAIAAASIAAGFDPPPQLQGLLDTPIATETPAEAGQKDA